jgi:hypothetical protein
VTAPLNNKFKKIIAFAIRTASVFQVVSVISDGKKSNTIQHFGNKESSRLAGNRRQH